MSERLRYSWLPHLDSQMYPLAQPVFPLAPVMLQRTNVFSAIWGAVEKGHTKN